MPVSLPVAVPSLVLALLGALAGLAPAPAEGAKLLPPVKGKRAVLWAVGDAALPGQTPFRVAETIEAGNPDRFLYLGDVYERGTAEEYESNYEPPFGRFDSIAAPTPGNHEWANRDEGYLAYWSRAFGTAMPDWFALRAGRWQLLSLNSEADHDPESRQLEWLERRLERSPRFGNCRIAFWHRPRYSAASAHGDDPDMEPFWDALAGQAKLVLNGHEHDMQRFRRKRGIFQLISGAGGRSLYAVDESDPRLRFANDSDFGALKVRLKGRRAKLVFVDDSGDVLDRSRVRCRRSRPGGARR